MDEARTNREAVMVEAADWLVRLDAAKDDTSLRQAFETWKAESPGHSVAVARLLRAWELSRRLTLSAVPSSPAVLAMTGRKPRSGGWAPAGLAAGGLIAATMGAAMLSSATSYATGVGERRVVDLGGGASVELNTDTKIRVTRHGRTRVVKLQRGEVLVKTGADPSSVEVEAAGRQLTASNADFDIRLVSNGMDVATLDGSVNVRQPGADGSLVEAGQIATLEAEAAALRVDTVPLEVERRLAWREGRLAFHGQTLGEVAAEFNRYNRMKITVSPSAATLRVGGVFDALSPDAFARSAARAFGLQVQRTDEGLRLAAAPNSPA